jgi:hypothetical protein
MRFDPCLVAKEKDMFSIYSEVSIEFQLEDMDGNLLPLDLCQVVECGVRLLHANDGLEAKHQAKRERFYDLDMRWEDYFGVVIRRRKKRRHN